MKSNHSPRVCAVLGLAGLSAFLLSGCSREAQHVPVLPLPPVVVVPPVASAPSVPVPVAALPPGASAPVVATPPAPVSITPQVRDFEDRNRLRDYSEKVYVRWNEALAHYRKEHRRLPATLEELKQFRPKLGELTPPPGYELQLDTASAEINVLPVSTGKLSVRNP